MWQNGVGVVKLLLGFPSLTGAARALIAAGALQLGS